MKVRKRQRRERRKEKTGKRNKETKKQRKKERIINKRNLKENMEGEKRKRNEK